MVNSRGRRSLKGKVLDALHTLVAGRDAGDGSLVGSAARQVGECEGGCGDSRGCPRFGGGGWLGRGSEDELQKNRQDIGWV